MSSLNRGDSFTMGADSHSITVSKTTVSKSADPFDPALKDGNFGSTTLQTLPDVFIIESLDKKSNGGVQGQALAHALQAFGRYPRYVDVSSRREFYRALECFKDSGYRYLHVSCHGDSSEDGLILRNNEKLSFSGLINWIAKLHLPLTRLFLSACGAGRKDFLANGLFSHKETRSVHSVLAPMEDIDLTEALVFWVSFYGEMYMQDEESMIDNTIIRIAQSSVDCCRRKFSYFSYDSVNRRIRHWIIEPSDVIICSPSIYPSSPSLAPKIISGNKMSKTSQKKYRVKDL